MAAISAMSGRRSGYSSGRRSPEGPRPRLCARQGCAAEASSTMTYDYAGRCVWLDELDPEASPAGYDLCTDHADRLAVPSGWSRTDRRPSAPSPFARLAV
ncbi:MAG: DUF3499 family protein [Actinomycetota bacterium]|nr:DUF3499 family protein [Actinomycetota bacterium]